MDRRFHRLSRYPFVSPHLVHPPARLDFIRRDALDPLTGKPQLGAAEKAVVTLVPDRPRPEAVLLPLRLGGASVTQSVLGVPRCTGMLGFIEPRQGEEAQSPCPENDSALLRLHPASMAGRSGVIPERGGTSRLVATTRRGERDTGATAPGCP